MALVKLDRKHPDAALPQLEKVLNEFLPVGTVIQSKNRPPVIGEWRIVSVSSERKEYERIR